MIYLLSLLIQPAVACDPAPLYPVEFFPSDQSTGVPLDSQIVLFARGAYMDEEFIITLNDDSNEILGSTTAICSANEFWNLSCFFIFEPDEPLEANVTYTAQSNTWDGEWKTTFTTGDSDTNEVLEVPSVSFTERIFYPEDDFCGTIANYNLSFEASNLIVVDDGNSHLYIHQVNEQGDVLELSNLAPIDSDEKAVSVSLGTETDGAGCFKVTQIHQNGSIIGESNIVCVDAVEDNNDINEPVDDSDEEKGCSSTGSHTPLNWIALVVLIGLSFVRRR